MKFSMTATLSHDEVTTLRHGVKNIKDIFIAEMPEHLREREKDRIDFFKHISIDVKAKGLMSKMIHHFRLGNTMEFEIHFELDDAVATEFMELITMMADMAAPIVGLMIRMNGDLGKKASKIAKKSKRIATLAEFTDSERRTDGL